MFYVVKKCIHSENSEILQILILTLYSFTLKYTTYVRSYRKQQRLQMDPRGHP